MQLKHHSSFHFNDLLAQIHEQTRKKNKYTMCPTLLIPSEVHLMCINKKDSGHASIVKPCHQEHGNS